MTEYDLEDILEKLKGFARVEDIDDIVILGVNGGVRRIIVQEYQDDISICEKCGGKFEAWQLSGCFVDGRQIIMCEQCIQDNRRRNEI